MMTPDIKNKMIGLGLFLSVFAVDLIIKYLATDGDYQIFGSFLELSYHENTGIAFSLPIPIWISSVLSVLLLGVGSYAAGRYLNWNKLMTPVIFGLVAGGALGNLFDRVMHGYVIDYIAIWKWPVFNLADAAIFVGAVLLVIFYDKIALVKNKK
ncbi:signal peptidase II [Candidatus Peregrinibacteria bacterium CG22_combo_CG10-13_8_21_14_all_44_10]|nr:MAG: signal peptidase II [Candidatus Peregrinibacteria bacterium CG22_combo_CG10-13_8_21_14_all_44_10]PIS04520.1 MAG: signal peptidase II [Candidatus Peregrinibacteria bacterium CG10_big_fil_rev_8_21_14_0_10_44_7]PIX80204.1 MAG: signal peptidase II [Candidatus Peregrinibacteria bacterium CG_4_10_14_3_um_filter_44_21]